MLSIDQTIWVFNYGELERIYQNCKLGLRGRGSCDRAWSYFKTYSKNA